MIYTHGPLGEYGHPHHQDVCYAVHSVFNKKTKIMAVAYNCEPQQKVILNSAQLKMKQFILANIYGSETKRFINLLPATHSEGFTEFSFAEVESIYNFFINGEIPNKKDLKYYKWFKWYFQNKKFQNLGRPF